MNIDRKLVPRFERWLKATYGCEAELEPDSDERLKRSGELARFMLDGSHCLILREHEFRRSEDSVEVFLSDKKLLGKIDDEFYLQLQAEMETDTSVQSEGGETENQP